MNFSRTNKEKQKLFNHITSYSPIAIILRFSFISVFAILVLNFIANALSIPYDTSKIEPVFYLIVIVSFNMMSEGQIAMDSVLERFLPVPEKIKLRFFIQFLMGILIIIFTHQMMMKFFPNLPVDYIRPGLYLGLLAGLLFVNMLANSLVIARFTEKWIDSQNQIAEMKQEKLKMDYNSLQDQINPHFLFNNLSVLKSLIIYDKKKAVTFTENFTDVYRYVLRSKDKLLIDFKEEQDFIYSYVGLHKERLGMGLKVRFSIEKDAIEQQIAPLTLQLLVENAIKHNIASTESPLIINISTKNDLLVVENNIQPRVSSYSTKTGLSNLIMRYKILTNIKLEVINDNKTFKVKVPLI